MKTRYWVIIGFLLAFFQIKLAYKQVFYLQEMISLETGIPHAFPEIKSVENWSKIITGDAEVIGFISESLNGPIGFVVWGNVAFLIIGIFFSLKSLRFNTVKQPFKLLIVASSTFSVILIFLTAMTFFFLKNQCANHLNWLSQQLANQTNIELDQYNASTDVFVNRFV